MGLTRKHEGSTPEGCLARSPLSGVCTLCPCRHTSYISLSVRLWFLYKRGSALPRVVGRRARLRSAGMTRSNVTIPIDEFLLGCRRYGQSDGLHPPKDLFDQLPLALASRIPCVASRAALPRTSFRRKILVLTDLSVDPWQSSHARSYLES